MFRFFRILPGWFCESWVPSILYCRLFQLSVPSTSTWASRERASSVEQKETTERKEQKKIERKRAIVKLSSGRKRASIIMTNHVNCQDESIVEVQVEVKVARMEKERRRETWWFTCSPSLYLSVISCNIQMHSNQELGWSPSSFPDVLDGLSSCLPLFRVSPSLIPIFPITIQLFIHLPLPSLLHHWRCGCYRSVRLSFPSFMTSRERHTWTLFPNLLSFARVYYPRQRTRGRTKSNSVELSKEIERDGKRRKERSDLGTQRDFFFWENERDIKFSSRDVHEKSWSDHWIIGFICLPPTVDFASDVDLDTFLIVMTDFPFSFFAVYVYAV